MRSSQYRKQFTLWGYLSHTYKYVYIVIDATRLTFVVINIYMRALTCLFTIVCWLINYAFNTSRCKYGVTYGANGMHAALLLMSVIYLCFKCDS